MRTAGGRSRVGTAGGAGAAGGVEGARDWYRRAWPPPYWITGQGAGGGAQSRRPGTGKGGGGSPLIINIRNYDWLPG